MVTAKIPCPECGQKYLVEVEDPYAAFKMCHGCNFTWDLFHPLSYGRLLNYVESKGLKVVFE